MKSNAIRVRIKSTKQIVEVRAQDINQYGELRLPVEKEYNGEKFYDSVVLKPNSYEIIPEQDFYDFRNNTAAKILCTLIQQKDLFNEDDLVGKAVRMTDKLIEKL